MSLYTRREQSGLPPRLPLDGSLDLTYRCNNACRHCWLWLPANAAHGREELSFEELRGIVDEARSLGCQAWAISGGEPMLRPDFAEIFDYITRRSVSYSLNTNGTLITPEIARLMQRKGRKMVALYGATAEVHDRVTRNHGSFEAMLRGCAYLKEAGSGFEVQIVPMRENFQQYQEMLALAESLSPRMRVGAPWLWLSACGSAGRNREIAAQRLEPAEVIALDQPIPSNEALFEAEAGGCGAAPADGRLFANCVASRRDFHIDPYGQMSFCYYIKDPALRYDLRRGSLRQAWEEFIPSLAEAVCGDEEYRENCGACELRQDCRWCGVHGYLEHGRYTAKVEYLCRVAAEARRFKEDWKLAHLRYYQIAGITIRVRADFPLTDDTFSRVYDKFRVDGPGTDTITVRLASPVPAVADLRLGKEVYRRSPWAIYQQRDSWVYLGISAEEGKREPRSVAVFNQDHSEGTIYHPNDFHSHGELVSLTTFPSDQLVLARVLAERQGCYVHASGFDLDGKGLLFVGHSGAGKSTMMKMLRGQGEILCDDRIIVRRWPDGFQIHGTWSHGELPDVSPGGAPLRAICYLEQASTNELIPLEDRRERLGLFLSHVVKPLATADWWEKILALAGKVAAEVPAYRLRFDKSGQVVELLRQL